ncbi:MAG: META domain-containing protein [Chloroflexi bacterium]|nr:META domain-containing protein [Chloroflexota bacterium]
MNRRLSSAALVLGGLLALSAAPVLAADASPAASAGPSEQPMATPLEGTTWLLTNARLSGAYGSIPADVSATLVLNDGRAGGSGGCNQWFADYTLDGDSLTFGIVGSTMMFCDGDRGTIETFYLADLRAVAVWAIDGSTLTLSASDGQPVLAFTVQPVPSLVGSWVVTGYNNGADAVVGSDGDVVTLTFDATSVSGNAGCNGFSGTWTLDGDTLAISPLMSTRMACEPTEIMTREAAVMAALEASTVIRSEADGSISLLDASGAVQLTLVAGGTDASPSMSPAA